MICEEEEESVGMIEKVSSLEEVYELGRTIGRGEFAKVAIKIVSCNHQSIRHDERLYREITILSRLNHPNIIKLVRVLRLPDRLALVMEYASGGELFDHVQASGHLPEIQVRIIMSQIFKAVEYLHDNQIVHRDLKLENILRNENGQVFLTDFGFATTFDFPGAILQTACGSPCYAAPELVLDKKGYQGPPADIWSCGVIMYAMAYGHLPFESDITLERIGGDPVAWTPANVYHLYQYIATHPVVLPRTPADGLGPAGQDLLKQLLCADSTCRITMSAIWTHPWLVHSNISDIAVEHPIVDIVVPSSL